MQKKRSVKNCTETGGNSCYYKGTISYHIFFLFFFSKSDSKKVSTVTMQLPNDDKEDKISNSKY